MSTTKNQKQQGPAAPPSDAEDLLRKAEKLRQCTTHLREAEKLRQDVGHGLGYGLDGILDRVATIVEQAAAVAEESAVPIAIGDVVRVVDENRPRDGLLRLELASCGPKRVYLKNGVWRPQAYGVEDGVEIAGGRRCIVPADLHRIQRDLARAPRGAGKRGA